MNGVSTSSLPSCSQVLRQLAISVGSIRPCLYVVAAITSTQQQQPAPPPPVPLTNRVFDFFCQKTNYKKLTGNLHSRTYKVDSHGTEAWQQRKLLLGVAWNSFELLFPQNNKVAFPDPTVSNFVSSSRVSHALTCIARLGSVVVM